MNRVIPHKKAPREPRPQKPRKAKRYRVEYFVYSEDTWRLKATCRYAWQAKQKARYWEDFKNFQYRVVDTHA